jgi:hypothetical protein
MALKVCFLGAVRRRTFICCRNIQISTSSAVRDRKKICDHPNNEPDKISHPERAPPDSRSTASEIEFAIGTGIKFSGFKCPRARPIRGGAKSDTHRNVEIAGAWVINGKHVRAVDCCGHELSNFLAL